MTNMDDATRPDGLRLALERPQPPPSKPAPWNLPSAWHIPDIAPEEPGDPPRPLAALVSFHYLRSAVLRQWLLCLLLALVGVLLGVGYLAVTPALPTATVTLMLSHEVGSQPSDGMATDISLLTTRTVAERTIDALSLPMTPDALRSSVTAIPSDSPEILQLTMTGPTEAEAIRRIQTFTQEYLAFRATEVSARSELVIKEYNDRIAVLQERVRAVNSRIQALAASGDTTTDRLSDAVTERSQFNGQIGRLQSTVQDLTLERATIVAISRVIDPPAVVPPSGARRGLLALGSGLIGGGALGIGIVVLQALLSDRLRLRVEVASALNAPVKLSVRRLAPLPRILRAAAALPWVGARSRGRLVDRQRVGQVLQQVALEPGRRPSLGVLCLGTSQEMTFGLVEAAQVMQRGGRDVTIVDLTETGRVHRTVTRLFTVPEGRLRVVRPNAVPSLAKRPPDVDPGDWGDLSDWQQEASRPADDGREVLLVLADLDPAVGVDHMTAWTDRVIVAVTGGRSSVELVRTAGDQVRVTGLHLHGAVLLGAVKDDMSSGIGPDGGDGAADPSEAGPPVPGAVAAR